MAAPNIVNATSIIGKTTYLSLSGTSATVLISNAASSNTLIKVNSIIIANDDGATAADITVSVHDAASGGGTAYKLAHTVTVAADSTLVVIDKTTPVYLEENRSITCTASAANDLDVVCSYEEIT
jgi:hypothetical protein